MNATEIVNAYTELERARSRYNEFGEAAILARYYLECAKREERQAGRIVGKNETEREDSARAALPSYYKQVDIAEADEREAKFLLDQALVKVEMIRALLRLEEINARIVQTGADG